MPIRWFIACLLCVLLSTGCNKPSPDNNTTTKQDPDLVHPGSELLKQLTITEVSSMPVSDILRVAGRIDFDERALTRIGANVTGRITQILAHLGTSVKQHDTLALLNSSELSNLQLAYLKALSQTALNHRNVERAKLLYQSDVIGAAELQRRENEYEISAAESRAVRDQLRVLGVQAPAIERLAQTGNIDSVSHITATINGVVVERNIAIGQVVQPSDALFVVADLATVWAVAQVPEQQIGQVKVGQSVNIEVPALRNEKLSGTLIYVGQTVNPETRTVLVRSVLDNRDGRLKPAMLATMLIESPPVQHLVVPTAAVVREGDEDYVFVAAAHDAFRLTRIKLSNQQVDGQRVVLDGLKPGSRIVSKGAFHLNNQRNLNAVENSN